jgi:hypothetical protein
MIVCVIVFQVWLRVQFPDGLVAADMVRRWVF